MLPYDNFLQLSLFLFDSMEAYEKLIKAIILTESKGKGTDLMQSSESLHGEADIIDNPADSIDQAF